MRGACAERQNGKQPLLGREYAPPLATSRARPGSRYPHVLPLPVLATATRSRPASASGHATAWMGVGDANAPRSAACSAAGNGASSKL